MGDQSESQVIPEPMITEIDEIKTLDAFEPTDTTDKPEPIDEPEQIRQEMEATREQLAEKVGLLENRISGAVETVSSALDVRKHVQDHPWLTIGVVAAAGFTAGWAVSRLLAPAPRYVREDMNLAGYPAATVVPARSGGLFTELATIAGAALRGAAYELSARAVPMAVDVLLANTQPTAAQPTAQPADVLPFGEQRQAK